MQSKRTLFLIEVAIFTAFALALDIIPFLSFKIWAQGGSISFAMIPIFIVAFRWGMKGGLLAGFLYGMLQIMIGVAWIIHPAQALLDYPIAFTALGLAGLFAPQAKRSLSFGKTQTFVTWVLAGVSVAIILRFISHYLAGVIFFSSTIDGLNIWMYSFVYNGSYLFPSLLINVLVVSFLFNKRPSLLKTAP
ncbi:thiamine transporter [Streptohalobacillus salinus]|uniref:Thiamine transporter n=1 Tax=Streptohalobacillus salinus TaxID=621096 RepID=A0A2V3WBK1_9BACI|nr:energy-coupled thiamine transporter ThiT [Streptohalobacillus salinus]PXW90906.1 thiamine transporter [Streptohalobacillus salinus]